MSHVLYVSLGDRSGGAERSLLTLIESLSDRHRVDVICPHGSWLLAKAMQRGCSCHGLVSRRSASFMSIVGIVELVRLSFQIRKICSRVRPDIIHANNIYASVICLLAVLCYRCRLIWHARDVCRIGWMARLCGRASVAIVSVSHAVGKHLTELGVGTEKVHVIHNAVEGKSPSNTSQRNSSAEHDTVSCPPFIFANIGQLVEWKKQLLFVQAASRVVRKRCDAQFWIVGDDTARVHRRYRQTLLDAIAEDGIEMHVRFVQWQDDIESIWDAVSCLVHTADCEPFGRVVLEAMLHRVPVIAVDAFGPGEIIDHERTGILVPANDPDALARAMLTFIDNPEVASRIASNAREDALRRFSVDTMSQKIHKLYESLLPSTKGEA